MHNLIVGGSTPKSIKDTNDRIVESALTYDVNSHWISANELELSSGAATYTAGTVNSPAYWTIKEGAAGYLTGYVRRHQEWRDGTLGINLHWSALEGESAGPVAVFRLGIGVAALKPVNVGFTAPTLFAYSLVYDTFDSLIVSTLRSAPLNAETAITTKHGGAWVIIGKAAADIGDTSTSDRKIYGIEVFYTQRRNQAGSYKTG